MVVRGTQRTERNTRAPPLHSRLHRGDLCWYPSLENDGFHLVSREKNKADETREDSEQSDSRCKGWGHGDCKETCGGDGAKLQGGEAE